MVTRATHLLLDFFILEFVERLELLEAFFRITANSDAVRLKEGRPESPSFALRLSNYKHCDPHSGMQHVIQEVLAIDVLNVAIVVIRPLGWPLINQLE